MGILTLRLDSTDIQVQPLGCDQIIAALRRAWTEKLVFTFHGAKAPKGKVKTNGLAFKLPGKTYRVPKTRYDELRRACEAVVSGHDASFTMGIRAMATSNVRIGPLT